MPITIGLSRWLNPENDDSEESHEEAKESATSTLTNFLSPQTYSVAAITVANGSDNIGIYVPLFANSNFSELLVIIAVFFSLVGTWCYASYKLSSQKFIADILTSYGSNLMPFVLIGLGVFIVLESHALNPLALVASSLCLMGIVKKYGVSAEVKVE